MSASELPQLPEASALAALRSWCEGVPARDAVRRFMGEHMADGQSSRAILGRVRRQIVSYARSRHQEEIAHQLETLAPGKQSAKVLSSAIEHLRRLPDPSPLVTDDVERWLAARTCRSLRAAGIRNLADLTVRVPRRRQWWKAVPGLGVAGARQVEAFFATHPQLTQRARELLPVVESQGIAPWESLVPPEGMDGSKGAFRAPRESCALRASNDYEAVQAWLGLHESESTRRAYRKEAERLMLWALVERGCALSSLTTEDATAYRGFLRRPAPRARWVGPARPRTSPDWRPFAGDLSARSVSYSISVLGALFRWLIEQRYVLANPFSGIKVRGGSRTAALDVSRAFTDGEWALLRVVADGVEWSGGWTVEAAQRLRFVLDFCYCTGLRAGELVGCTLALIRWDASGSGWIDLVGKGAKTGKVALPPRAIGALESYLAQRGLTTVRARWDPKAPLVASLQEDAQPITSSRLWQILKRFFLQAAKSVEADAPVLAEKLRRASPHWMRHTHASHALAEGADLTTVRDNLRHASISTTSTYLHGDDIKRARQLGNAFR